MKKCCNKCHNSECQEPYRGQCDTFPMYIDRINKSRERARLQIARSTFSDAFGDTYSFQFTSRINATIYSYSLEVVDGNLMLTDEKQWCYPVNENENELKLCNILTVEDLFDIISIGIKTIHWQISTQTTKLLCNRLDTDTWVSQNLLFSNQFLDLRASRRAAQ